jgi:hypothetical protein
VGSAPWPPRQRGAEISEIGEEGLEPGGNPGLLKEDPYGDAFEQPVVVELGEADVEAHDH